ncbi:unnamed protein product [Allacma fusca]|uniref:Uncharacterized protein n=1 Tax=Allacma fusca TaxID=39272 RepID=A0A8J2L4U4_9HEXA|nr:unnamed protein product [Allacma fusca]
MVCRLGLSDTSIQFQFPGELDVDVLKHRVVEPDDDVVLLGGHVGGIPLVNRGQVARHGRRSGRPFVRRHVAEAAGRA